MFLNLYFYCTELASQKVEMHVSASVKTVFFIVLLHKYGGVGVIDFVTSV